MMNFSKSSRSPRVLPRWIFPALAMAILLADQVTKFWADTHLRFPGDSRVVVNGFFHLTRVHNDGMAFGLFQGNNALLTVVVTLILLVGFWMARHLDWKSVEVNLVAGCVVGGALGNLVDRLRFGYVLDFFDFNLWITRWPAFNIADAAISCSMVWIAFRLLKDDVLAKSPR
jgi:signal peptidase II